MRAVLDANVFVSALLSRTGAPARLVERWLDGELEVVVCERLLDEVERTLAHRKLGGRVDAGVAARFVALLRELGELAADPEDEPPIRSQDPDDDYLLALAARERAPLVTGDSHLLALAERVPVFSPREFLDKL
ncbi:MAG TPA: putative toxin-antitoxin system toxin component, PIN family [Gaiellaceae bacterium]|nr:putative toxin-antitoxin system toxin component, PIN family [Gaiellaceae bacterium]